MLVPRTAANQVPKSGQWGLMAHFRAKLTKILKQTLFCGATLDNPLHRSSRRGPQPKDRARARPDSARPTSRQTPRQGAPKRSDGIFSQTALGKEGSPSENN